MIEALDSLLEREQIELAPETLRVLATAGDTAVGRAYADAGRQLCRAVGARMLRSPRLDTERVCDDMRCQIGALMGATVLERLPQWAADQLTARGAT